MSENEAKKPELNAFAAYMAVGGISAAASIIIAFVALERFNEVSGSALWAMAAMILSPSVMAVGVSYFINQSHRHSATTSIAEKVS